MPENSIENQPQPVPTPPPNKPNNIKFYVICTLSLALLVVCYTYFNKYRETKTVLDQKEISLTKSESSRQEIMAKFSDYKNTMESKTSYVKKPYMFNGSLVLDGHGNATYVKIYLKDKKLTNIGNSTSFNELSETVTVTQAVTVTVHKVDSSIEGSKSNGIAYISLPAELAIGKLPRIGFGADHNFILGTAIGLGAGTTDIKAPIEHAYVDLHLGLQIP